MYSKTNKTNRSFSYKNFKIILSLLCLLNFQQISAQIFSTTTGGNWEDTTAWVGYKIPGALDSVIIQGPMTLNFDAPSMHDLFITESGSFLNGWQSNVTVSHNVWVNGTVDCASLSDFKIGGDFHLNGKWKANINFTGTQSHLMTTAATSALDPYSHILAIESNIIAGSDIYIRGNGYPAVVAKTIDLSGGFSMHLSKVRLGQQYYYDNGGLRTKVIGGNNSIYLNEDRPTYMDQYFFEFCDLQDVTLRGRLFFAGGVRLLGEVIIADTLKAAVGVGNWVVETLGNFTNNGTIENPGLRFTFHNNVTNNGIFDPSVITFLGTNDHQVVTSPGNWINFISNFVSEEGKIVAGSDLYISSSTSFLNAKEIDLTKGYNLYLKNVRVGYSANTYRTVITGGGNSITMSGTNQYYEKCDLNNVTLKGKSIIGSDADFYGEVVNQDTIHTSNNYTIDVHGNFSNNGKVLMLNGYWPSFNFHQNLTNNGTLEAKKINFVGSNDHIIKTLNSKFINFYSELNAPDGKLVAESDLYFKSNLGYLIAKEIDLTKGYDLYLQDLRVGWNSAAYKTKINGGGNSVYLRGGLNSYYENSDLYDVALKGYTVFKGNNNDLYGEIVNADTLTNNSIITLNSHGNFTNHGIMFNSSYDINMNIYGDLTNDSNYAAISTNLVGVHDQHIFLPTNKPLNSMITNFKCELSGTVYKWRKDGNDISNATTNQLSFNSPITANAYGTYQCIVDGQPSRKIFIGQSAPAAFEIYDVNISNLSATQTKVEWKTTVPASGFIFYAENDTTNGYPLEAMEPQGAFLQHSLMLENLTKGSTYYFIIDQNDAEWNNIRSLPYSFVAGDSLVGINDETSAPLEFSLSQNYPNPFNPATIIKYSIPQSGKVSLKIFDLLGKEIAEIVNEQQDAGRHEVAFEAFGLSSGFYFYRLTSGTMTSTKKMLLIK